MDTSGVGTRMELPVSLPSSSGSALATALAAPVSVITMFSAAERPRRSPLWKLSIRFWSLVNEWTVSTWPCTTPYLSLMAFSTGVMALVVQEAAETICVRVGDVAVVDAVHDVLQVALARCGQQDAGHALAQQVLGQALGVAPAAGVVHHEGVLDAVGGVVDRGGVVRVDDLDLDAVGRDGVGVGVHLDGAFEGAVDGVAAQQAGALGRSLSEPRRTTMARRRRPWPPPAFSIRRRASSRPMRPKP